jgi:hypothetical protein
MCFDSKAKTACLWAFAEAQRPLVHKGHVGKVEGRVEGLGAATAE